MVEIIPKKPEKGIPIKNIFLFVAGGLLLAAVFGYVIIVRSESEILLAVQDVEADILRVGTEEDKKIENKVLDAEKKIKGYEVLLAGNRKPSQFFGNFESLVHPKIWFSQFELDVAEMQATVSGQAEDFLAMEQQLIFLKQKSDFINSFELSELSIGEDEEAKFGISFDFTTEIFNSTSTKE